MTDELVTRLERLIAERDAATIKPFIEVTKEEALAGMEAQDALEIFLWDNAPAILELLKAGRELAEALQDRRPGGYGELARAKAVTAFKEKYEALTAHKGESDVSG